MILKLFGGGFLVLAGVLFGHCRLSALRARERTLRELSSALGFMQNELTLLQTPLPQIFEKQRSCLFFRLLTAGFGTEATETLWRRAAMSLDLPAEAAAALSGLGCVIGRYDAARQVAEIEIVRSQLSDSADRLSEEIAARGKSFTGLGAAAGAMLAVILF